MKPPKITLKKAAERLGVAPITLKRWFLDGRVDEVGRDRNGWRVFDDADIDRLRQFVGVQEKPAEYAPVAPSTQPTVASLFTGIGGFDLGFQQQGFKVVFQAEINRFCQAVLAHHWPDVPKHKDIKELSSAAIPSADVWVAGFPCQDVSLARMGKRDGLRGRQSGLFYEFARLVGEARPRVLVVENVHGLLNSHGGRDFGIVLSTLAGLGYSLGWRTLNSRYFGVPQSRRRVYIVGCYRDRRGPPAILFEPERGGGDAAPDRSDGTHSVSAFKKVIGDPSKEGPVVQSIAYCLYACSARHTGTDWSRTYVSYPREGRVRRLIPRECEGVMAFPEGWTALPDDEWDDLDSLRYHALGNAVTPPTAAWLAGRIRAYLEATATDASAKTG